MVRRAWLLMVLALVMTACEKPLIEDAGNQSQSEEDGANVRLRFSLYDMQDFTRAASPLLGGCTRLSVAIFNETGTKIKSIQQTASDAAFGTAAVLLTDGTYTVVAVAHSSTEGHATITSTEKVTFANNKMTDTFSACETFTVGEQPTNTDEQAEAGIPISEYSEVDRTITLHRVVAMVRLTVKGTIPDEVKRFKFYYTGGSSTLNPTTGYGCVQSKQTEYRSTVCGDTIATTYELFTAPHDLNDVLKLVITAQDQSGATKGEWTMDNVPVTRNKITTWTGRLFKDNGTGEQIDGGISLTLNPTWDGTVNYTW